MFSTRKVRETLGCVLLFPGLLLSCSTTPIVFLSQYNVNTIERFNYIAKYTLNVIKVVQLKRFKAADTWYNIVRTISGNMIAVYVYNHLCNMSCNIIARKWLARITWHNLLWAMLLK